MAEKWTPPPAPDTHAMLLTAAGNWFRDKPKVIAFDTETTGLEFHDAAFCTTLAWYHPDPIIGMPGVYGYYIEHAEDGAIEFLRGVFKRAEVICGHNLPFDLHRASRAGYFTEDDWTGKRFDDTEAMAHLDDEQRPKGLKKLAVSVLGEEDVIDVPKRRHLVIDGVKQFDENGKKIMEDYTVPTPRELWELGEAKEWAKKELGLASVEDVGYHQIPRGTLIPYAIKDAEFTLRLAQALFPRIQRYPDLLDLYEREVWNTTRGPVYHMEKVGMRVRVDYVADKVKEYRKLCLAHEIEIEKIVGKPVRTGKMSAKERPQFFNPGSSSDDPKRFFAAAGFERASYDADNLKTIDHPLATVLLAYRKDIKLLDGYYLSLQKALGGGDIFHPHLRYHGTVSGRTSAGGEQGDG